MFQRIGVIVHGDDNTPEENDLQMQTTTQTTDAIVSIVCRIVLALIDDWGTCTFQARTEDDTTCIMVRLTRKDLPKVLGRQAKIAHAIRTLVGAMGKPHRYTLDIDERPPTG